MSWITITLLSLCLAGIGYYLRDTIMLWLITLAALISLAGARIDLAGTRLQNRLLRYQLYREKRRQEKIHLY